MKLWFYAINSIHKTASLYLEEKPWWVWVLKEMSDFLCGKCPEIPFLPIPLWLSKKDAEELNDDKRWTNFKYWYGDLSQWWHLELHDPILEFCDKRTLSIDDSIDYDKTREFFYEKDKAFWDENEKMAKESRASGWERASLPDNRR